MVTLCKSGLVTTTETAPAVLAGVRHVRVVADDTVTYVALVFLNFTVSPLTKFVPLRVTSKPPVTEPLVGATLVKVGRGSAIYVKAFALVTLCKSGLVTTTETAPAVLAGVRHVKVVADDTTTDVALVFLNFTVSPLTKPVPLRVTSEPPARGPLAGATLVKVGAGAGGAV